MILFLVLPLTALLVKLHLQKLQLLICDSVVLLVFGFELLILVFDFFEDAF